VAYESFLMRLPMRAVNILLLAYPSRSLAQPASDWPDHANAIVEALRWVEDLLVGKVATAIAIVAVAIVGMAMLMGRFDWRHGVTVVLGCFIVFGASTIASGFTADLSPAGQSSMVIEVPPPPKSPVIVRPATPEPYDPYSGAAVAPK